MITHLKSLFSAVPLQLWVTLVLGLLGLFISWIKDLGASARRAQFLNEATNTLEFWEKWLGTINVVSLDTSVDKATVEAEIRRLGSRVTSFLRKNRPIQQFASGEFVQYRAGIGQPRQALLLYRQPSKAARIARYCMYMLSLILFVLEPLLWITEARVGHLSKLDVVFSVLEIAIGIGFARILASIAETVYIRDLRAKETE